eukprot:5583743-Alexandrium_andersonii.AAC.1
MSASLVGSEMCIRDRGTSVNAVQLGSGRAPATPLWPTRPVGNRGPTPGTVSYTHLTLPTICSV